MTKIKKSELETFKINIFRRNLKARKLHLDYIIGKSYLSQIQEKKYIRLLFKCNNNLSKNDNEHQKCYVNKLYNNGYHNGPSLSVWICLITDHSSRRLTGCWLLLLLLSAYTAWSSHQASYARLSSRRWRTRYLTTDWTSRTRRRSLNRMNAVQTLNTLWSGHLGEATQLVTLRSEKIHLLLI